MFSHERLWAAIDTLAERNSLSASGLARKAGLDPTTFNKSKRFAADGRPRWPSTESLAKIMEATGTDIDEFASIINQKPVESDISALSPLRIQTVKLDHARRCDDIHDLMVLAKNGASFTEFPGAVNEQILAIELSDDNLHPQFCRGDLLIVTPHKDVKLDERVLLRTQSGYVLAGTILEMTPIHLVIDDTNSPHKNVSLNRSDVSWIAKLLWVSR